MAAPIGTHVGRIWSRLGLAKLQHPQVCMRARWDARWNSLSCSKHQHIQQSGLETGLVGRLVVGGVTSTRPWNPLVCNKPRPVAGWVGLGHTSFSSHDQAAASTVMCTGCCR